MLCAEQEIEQGKSVIYTFERRGNQKVISRVDDFHPYFYVPQNESIEGIGIMRVDEGFTGIKGEAVKKITVTSSIAVPFLRVKVTKSYEADIPFPTRFLIDRQDNYKDDGGYRIFYLDIEVCDSTFPRVDNPIQPIVCVCLYDNFTQKRYAFFWKETEAQRVEKSEKLDLYIYSNEHDMLAAFIKFFRATEPDIITGWNVIDFDITYLIQRMTALKIDCRLMSPIRKAFVEDLTKKVPVGKLNYRKLRRPIIKGVVLFDLRNGYRKLKFAELPSYTLQNVANEELGTSKLEIEGTTISWNKDWRKLVEYCLWDCELTKMIDEKLKIIQFHDALRKICHCSFDESMTNSMFIDAFLLHMCEKKKIVLPSKQFVDSNESKWKGASVLEPVSGKHGHCIGFDMKAMYPSIIMMLNASYETAGGTDIILEPRPDQNFKGACFSTKKKGIIPEMLEGLLVEREKHKELKRKYQAQPDSLEYQNAETAQYAYKMLSASVYGLCGFPRFRLYERSVSASTTFIGRMLIEHVKRYVEANRKGYKVLYGDTDSVYIEVPETTLEEIIKNATILCEEVNKSFKDVANAVGIPLEKWKVEIEFRDVEKRAFFHMKKKRYAYLEWWNGKTVTMKKYIKGFEAKRSDSSKVTRKIQKQVLDDILDDVSKQDIKKYIESETGKIVCGEYDYESIGQPIAIKKEKYKTDVPRMRALRWANKHLGTDFGVGDKILMLPVKGLDSDVIGFTNNSQLEGKHIRIDYDQLIEKTVVKKLKPIFEALGWTYGKYDQQSLTKYVFSYK